MRKKFTNPFVLDVRESTSVGLRRLDRSRGERWLLALCGLVTLASLIAAIGWPYWLTIHITVILGGLTSLLFLAPWLGEGEEIAGSVVDPSGFERSWGQLGNPSLCPMPVPSERRDLETSQRRAA